MVTLMIDHENTLFIGLTNVEISSLLNTKKFFLNLADFLDVNNITDNTRICIFHGFNNNTIKDDLAEYFEFDIGSIAGSTSENYVG